VKSYPSLLIEKRRGLARTIETLQQRLDQHWADLAHIDGALRLLGKRLDPAALRPKAPLSALALLWSQRIVLTGAGAVRTAAEPVGIEEISRRVVVANGFDPGDANLGNNIIDSENLPPDYALDIVRQWHIYDGALSGEGGHEREVEGSCNKCLVPAITLSP
jgi:hypothetical protein